MGAAFGGVDVVDVRVDVFGVFAAVLHARFLPDAFLFAADVDDIWVQWLAGAIEVLDEFDDAALVVKFVMVAGLIVFRKDPHAAIQERQFLQATEQNVV